jgi:23S rRNA (adenine2503-C2)-methyltransferase
MVKKSLCGLTADEIFDLISPSGFTFAHAVTVSNNIYKKSISDISQIPKIPSRLKEELSNIAVSGISLPLASEFSSDNSIKYLFRTTMGKEFETVFIPDKKRNTVCVSTQSGCRMGCSFCATARYGYKGDLTAGEIVNQIISIPQSQKITHVVFMGMGEPMDNLEHVTKACKIITAEWGLAISSRHVTVSTVGKMPEVEKFLQTSDCNLTFSLYSPFAKERLKIVPAEINTPSATIIEIMKKIPVKKKRRLTIAYVMVKDVNDTDSHLEGLKLILRSTAIRVNLLPYHSIGNDQNSSTSSERMQYFKHNLVISGISASIRKSRGSDISAACGLLAGGLKR